MQITQQLSTVDFNSRLSSWICGLFDRKLCELFGCPHGIEISVNPDYQLCLDGVEICDIREIRDIKAENGSLFIEKTAVLEVSFTEKRREIKSK